MEPVKTRQTPQLPSPQFAACGFARLAIIIPFAICLATGRYANSQQWTQGIDVPTSQPFHSPLDNPFNDPLRPQSPQQPYVPYVTSGVTQPASPAQPDSPLVDGQLTETPVAPVQSDDLPRDSRSGVFQNVYLNDTYMPRNGANGMMIDDAETWIVFGLPLPTRDSPLVLTPGFAAHFFDGPDNVPVPARTYDAYVQFRWIPQVTSCLRFDMAITPGYFGDYDRDGHKAIRETGYFTGLLKLSHELQLVLGADYTDLKTYPVLPVVGVIWKPDDNAEYRLVFPQPKISFRLAADGIYLRENNPQTTDYGSEWWAYISGELGGESWAIERAGVGVDLMTYSDLRAIIGLQHKIFRGLSSKIEGGYIFDRKVLFESDGLQTHPTSTAMVRAGVWY